MASFGLAACTAITGPSTQPTPEVTPQPYIGSVIPLPDGPAPLAMAVGAPGELWLTRPGSPDQPPVVGDLVRAAAAAGQSTTVRTVGGDPEAVAYSGAYVWVVNGFGDGKTPEADANSVVQLDPTTAVEVQRYQVDQPYGVAATGDRGWIVAAGPGDTTLLTVVQAQSVTSARLIPVAGGDPAGKPAIVVGGEAAYLVTSDSGGNAVYSVSSMGQVMAQQTLPTFGNAALAVDGAAVFATVGNVQAGGIYRLDGGTLALQATLSRTGSRSIATAHGHVWALSLDGGSVQAYDAGSGVPVSQPVRLRGRGYLVAADDQRVWVSTELNGTSQLELIEPS